MADKSPSMAEAAAAAAAAVAAVEHNAAEHQEPQQHQHENLEASLAHLEQPQQHEHIQHQPEQLPKQMQHHQHQHPLQPEEPEQEQDQGQQLLNTLQPLQAATSPGSSSSLKRSREPEEEVKDYSPQQARRLNGTRVPPSVSPIPLQAHSPTAKPDPASIHPDLRGPPVAVQNPVQNQAHSQVHGQVHGQSIPPPPMASAVPSAYGTVPPPVMTPQHTTLAPAPPPAGGSPEEEQPADGRKAKRELSQSKRAAQNRAAQRAFRQRKEGYIRKLEQQVEDFRHVQEEWDSMKNEVALLRRYVRVTLKALSDANIEPPYPQPPLNPQSLGWPTGEENDEFKTIAQAAVNDMTEEEMLLAHANEELQHRGAVAWDAEAEKTDGKIEPMDVPRPSLEGIMEETRENQPPREGQGELVQGAMSTTTA